MDRKARCTERPSRGERSSLWYWSGDVPLVRVMLNYVLTVLARVSPSFRFKNWLYRLMGARVAPTAAVGLEVTFDVFFPEKITVGEDVIIGYNTTILCHEYTRRWYRLGPVVVERDATIGANCTLLPGVIVGEGATVSAMSLVNRDIPPGETWGGVPVRRLKPAKSPVEPEA